VIGDIHGQAEALARLLARLEGRRAPGDRLVFIGDYIDRGPDSRRAVELALAAPRRWPGPVTPLKGNHEAMLLRALEGDPEMTLLWLENGGIETLASYGIRLGEPDWRERFPADHVAFFRSLRLWDEDEHAYYVHAGFEPGVPPAENDEETLLWIREAFIESDYAWEKPVVFGHTPQYTLPPGRGFDLKRLVWRPLVRPEKIGIDTGSAYGGPLTALVLPEREFVQVEIAPA